MLTEGWDVKNVFQIIPHEKRAFASKLLIAQVLGRGLRVPPGTSNPQVWVFNHVAWAGEIKGLVDEVLEQERRLHCYPVEAPPRDTFHFEVDQLTYETETEEQELVAKNGNGQVTLFREGYVQFEHQAEELERTDVFTSALAGGEMTLKTSIRYPAYSVDEVVKRIRGRLKSIDAEGETTYADEYPAPDAPSGHSRVAEADRRNARPGVRAERPAAVPGDRKHPPPDEQDGPDQAEA